MRTLLTIRMAMLCILVYGATCEPSTSEEQFNRGMELAGQENFQEALKWFTMAAENGSTSAQFELATIYHLHYAEWGIEQNTHEAMKWYKMAAKKGHSLAQNNLANLLYKRKDYQEALKWYKEAAEKGNPFGQFGLGFMCLNGKGTQKNVKKGVRLVLLSAQQDHGMAQYVFGDWMYENKIYEESYFWYLLAQRHEDDDEFLFNGCSRVFTQPSCRVARSSF